MTDREFDYLSCELLKNIRLAYFGDADLKCSHIENVEIIQSIMDKLSKQDANFIQ